MNAPLEVNAAAAELASEGLRVFEIPGRVKSPPVAGWQGLATSDPEMAGRIPTSSNLGIATGGGILGLDVDGEEGARSLAELEARHGKLPETCQVSTPSGGAHYYFTGPDVANSAGKIAPGLDIRGRGGYLVAPGSRTAQGEYTVAHEAEIAPAPQWLLDLCSKPREKTNTGAPVPDAAPEVVERAREWLSRRDPAIEGEGGDAHTYATACELHDLGVSEAQAVELMAGEWNERCAPPWALGDLQAKARNAYAYAQNAAGSRTALPEDFPVVEQPQQPIAKRRQRGGTLQEMAARLYSGALYLIKGLLYQGSHAVMYGAPGAGKSYVALDLAYHVAAGKDWMGRRVRQGPVLYLAFEGLGGMPKRAAALRQHYGEAAVPLFVEPGVWNLREKADRQALAARVAEIMAAEFSGQRPALIVLDTLARAMRGDENSAQDMGAMNAAVDALIEATGACVLLIHHSGKDRGKGARGSSALLGAVDTELEIDAGQIRATKQRDVDVGAPIGFKLTPLQVGQDEDGEPVLACVVEASAAALVKQWQPTGNNAHAWAALCDLSGASNAPVGRAELMRAFRARAYATGNVPESTPRRALDRALGALLDHGLIEGAEGGPWRRALK